MKKLARANGVQSFRNPYGLSTKRSPRSGSYAKKYNILSSSKRRESGRHDDSMAATAQKIEASDSAKRLEVMSTASSAQKLQASQRKLIGNTSSPQLRNNEMRVREANVAKGSSLFSSRYDMSSLFTTRKLTLKSNSRTHSEKHTARSNSDDKLSVSKDGGLCYSNVQISKTQNRPSKTTLYLHAQNDFSSVEPLTPTFEEPLQMPCGSSTPSSPHENAGGFKLITSLDLRKEGALPAQNFNTEPHTKALTTERQLSPKSIESSIPNGSGLVRQAFTLREGSLDSERSIPTHLKPILEQQDLIAGDRALSAIQSNESFDLQNRESHASMMKSHMGQKSSHFLKSSKRGSQQNLTTQSSKKKILSVTVTPAFTEEQRRSLKSINSPPKMQEIAGSVQSVMRALEPKSASKASPQVTLKHTEGHVSPKNIDQTNLTSGVTSPLDSQIIWLSDSKMNRISSSGSQTQRDGVQKQKAKHVSHMSVDMKKEAYTQRGQRSKKRLHSQLYTYQMNEGATTMDTTDQAHNSILSSKKSIGKSRDDIARKRSPLYQSQFDKFAQKLKKQLQGGNRQGNRNPSSLPTTPRDPGTPSRSYPSKSPENFKKKMVESTLERVPEAMSQRRASSSLSYQIYRDFHRKKPFYRAVVHSGVSSLLKEDAKNLKAYGSPQDRYASRSVTKLSHIKGGSYTDSRSPSTTINNPQDSQLKSIKTPSPFTKRQGMAAVETGSLDGVKTRVASLLGKYDLRFQQMRKEIARLRSQNSSLKMLFLSSRRGGATSLSPIPLTSANTSEILQFSGDNLNFYNQVSPEASGMLREAPGHIEVMNSSSLPDEVLEDSLEQM